MIIPITANYRITSDEMQWRVERRRSRKGAASFEPVSFHANMSGAIESLRERLVRASNAETLADALADMENVSATLSRALTVHCGDDAA